ncbi:chitooligosaccharide deacetylase NodB [Paraburkholderia sp. CNPSo 3076]|uniref:chitooligosaccharide deacetylase NodB n=1 Tax=Paraburkholderia sp. CNPSo 3076 TaxID=2940936 RepID=UPI00224DC802|nr:chitooligosaccharide deacetylase NodB [Paraburkholderia sp. CNPSo 3076]MCX5545361.1 chitooligosaccharide deacetylase NodB [Paraburkholderia sp. CNPSo 3076]
MRRLSDCEMLQSTAEVPNERERNGLRKVYLTFDDGPHPIWTPKILDLLARQRVPATFCVLGAYAAEYPELIRRMVSEGHDVANHSLSHRDLSKCEPGQIRHEIAEANALIQRACPAAAVRYMRAPYGKWTNDVISESMKAGLMSLHWSVDPRDWSRPGAEAIVDSVLTSVLPGSIVLLHDGAPPEECDLHHRDASRVQTVIALSRLILGLKERGFVISSLP